MSFRVILTGATGMVGEGVLLECLSNPAVSAVLVVGRRSCELKHEKLTEVLAPDFTKLDGIEAQLKGYDACFYCAGITSRGMNEEQYTKVTYDAPLHFAQVLARLNPSMTFCHVSGRSTDSSENGSVMWARVKGKAENALMKLPFKGVYNFRPALMKPTQGQKRASGAFKFLGATYGFWKLLFPGICLTMPQIAQSMIATVEKGTAKHVLEVRDMQALLAT